MLAAYADSELLGANIITGSVAVQHNAQNAHAQHPDHQHGSHYRRAAAAAAVLFKTTRSPPGSTGGWTEAWPTTRQAPWTPLRYKTVQYDALCLHAVC